MVNPRSATPVSAEEAGQLLRKRSGWPGMRVEGVLAFPENTETLRLPPDLEVEVLDLSNCAGIEELPRGLRCFELNLSGTRIESLPADLVVESIVNLSGCEELKSLPSGLTAGTLLLRGCSSLTALPE